MATDRPIMRMSFMVLVGDLKLGGGVGKEDGYAAASGEADSLLVTAVSGATPGDRQFKTTQCGPTGREPVSVEMLQGLGTHFLALAVDTGQLPDSQRQAVVAALHELRRPFIRAAGEES
jgi:hypothetical protein